MRLAHPAAVAILFLLSTVPVRAQASAPKSGYGTDDLQIVTVPMTRFLPSQSTTSYTTGCCLGIANGERWPTAGGNVLVADLDSGLLPNGVELTRIDFYVLDDNGDADADFQGNLCRTWVDAETGGEADGDCPIVVDTSGAPGQTVLPSVQPLDIFYDRDMDEDNDSDTVTFHLYARFGAAGIPVTDGSIRLRMVRMYFRRQVSPAPETATFGDVPASHPFFQFVEALSASGITAGCGSGNYCPEAPLTRGQMAVFLAKALGLHWPATVP